MKDIALSCLKPGDACKVLSIGVCDAMKHRLQDLGLNPGSRVSCDYIAPSGSPMAFRIKGALIALRSEDCKRIRVKRCG